MKLAIGADHGGFLYKNQLKEILIGEGHEVRDFGTFSSDSMDYPDVAVPLGKSVASGETDFGIIFCGSGIGVSISANKVRGVRAANCQTEEMARLSRQHNNANVLAMGERLMDFPTALAITRAFLSTEFEGGRHERRVEKIHRLTEC